MSLFETIPIRELSRYEDNSWIHLPYRSGLSITFNKPSRKDCNTLLVKISWKTMDLERLTFRDGEVCKLYEKYPLLALKYIQPNGNKRKLQLAFFSLQDFVRCIKYFTDWGIVGKNLTCSRYSLAIQDSQAVSYSQRFDFTQTSQQITTELSKSVDLNSTNSVNSLLGEYLELKDKTKLKRQLEINMKKPEFLEMIQAVSQILPQIMNSRYEEHHESY